jgi:hypothetical protein
VAELVDARDLKSQGPIDSIGLRPQTLPLSTIETDGTKRDLQNILGLLLAVKYANNFALVRNVTGVMFAHPF